MWNSSRYPPRSWTMWFDTKTITVAPESDRHLLLGKVFQGNGVSECDIWQPAQNPPQSRFGAALVDLRRCSNHIHRHRDQLRDPQHHARRRRRQEKRRLHDRRKRHPLVHFGLFREDPNTWDNLWSLNDAITNPHWIYPGNKIALTDHSPRYARL